MAEMVMEAQTRAVRGKGGARSTRRAGQLPAVVYGAHQGPITVSVNPRSVEEVLKFRIVGILVDCPPVAEFPAKRNIGGRAREGDDRPRGHQAADQPGTEIGFRNRPIRDLVGGHRLACDFISSVCGFVCRNDLG